MKMLEEEIDLLTELDDWRVKSASMRDAGRDMLSRKFHDLDIWIDSDGEVFEAATVLKALLAHRVKPTYPDELVNVLEKVSLKSAMQSDPDGVPVLRAARAMCSLAAAPSSAFSPSVMYIYYYVIREIYAADAPDWSMGGARAGEGMSPKAYVTWECINAILSFQRALEHTATMIGGIRSILIQRDKRLSAALPAAWEEVDAKRLRLEFSTTLQALRDNIVLRLPVLDEAEDVETLKFAADFHRQLKAEIKRCLRDFRRAVKEIRATHKALERSSDPQTKKRVIRLSTAHQIALSAVEDAIARAETALGRFTTARHPVKQLKELRQDFERAAKDTGKVLHPATNYVLRVLNRELAGAALSSSHVGWDPAEMAFAAVAYGEATERWNDERLRRALEHLTRMISERGRFPQGKPIHASVRLPTASPEFRGHPRLRQTAAARTVGGPRPGGGQADDVVLPRHSVDAQGSLVRRGGSRREAGQPQRECHGSTCVECYQ